MNLSYRLGVRLQRLLLPSQRLKKTIHRPYSPRLLFELLTLIFIVGAFAGYACLASAQLAVANGGSGSGVDTFSGAGVFYTSKATVSLVVPADSVRRTEGVISQTKITAENGGTPRSEVAQRQVKISKAQATAVPFRICFVSVFTTPSVEVQRGTSTSALVLDSNGCYIDELSANTKLSEIYYIYGKHDTTDDRSELVIIHLDNETNRARPKTVAPFYVRDQVTIRDDDPTMVSLARVDNGPIVEGKPYPEGEAEFTVTLSRRLFSGETIDVPFEIGLVKSFSEARMLLKSGGSINQGVSLKSRRSLNPVINFFGDDESVVQTANVILRAFDDRRVEMSDSVSIKLGPNDSSSTGFNHSDRDTTVGGGAQSATTETFTVQIKDQPGEIPVTLSVNQNGTITEGDSALITATLGSVNASNQPVLIPIQVRAAQTTATTLDYQMPALISIAPGQMAGSVIFATTDNSTDAADKQVVVELGALSAPHSADTPDHVSITIEDDEATAVTLAASTTQISETGSNNKADVTISLSRALKSGESLTVPLTVSGATVQTHYQLDLKSGSALNQGVSINANSPHSTQHPAIEFTGHATDVVDSATLELVAVHASDQLVRSVAIAFGSGTREPNGSGINDGLELAGSPQSVQIIDVDSGAPEVSVVRKHSHRHRESQNVTFTLTLSQVQAAATVVNVNVTQQGSYLKSGQQGVRQVTVPYGQTEVDFVVEIDDDNSDEANGEITASIEDGSGYSISTTGTSARVEVADDDGMPTVSIELVPDDEIIDNADGSSQVTESGTSSSPGAINFRVTANPTTLSPVTVKVNVTATGTVFQSGITGQRLVEIPANTSSANFIVGLENDATDELQGTVSVAIEADDTAYLVASAPDDAKTVIVLDDDPTAVVLTTTSDNTLTEGNPEDSTNVYISLSRKLNVGETVTVPLQLTSTTGVALPGAANSEIELMVAGYGVTASATNSATPSIRFTGHSTKTVQTATMTVMPTSRTDNDTSEDTIVVSFETPTATGLDDIRPSAVGTSHSSRVILQVNDQTESPAAGVVFSHPSVTLTPGASTAYQVWLQSDPEAEVVITVVSDHSEVRVDTDSTAAGDQNTLTFNASNWSTPQTVQLHIDSGSDSGGTSTFVWHRSTVATDSNHRYHNISIDEVSVQINDVDDDDYRVSLSVDNPLLFEGVQVRTISAVLDRPNNTGGPLSIPLRLGAGSTATATDYTLKVAAIQIPNNASSGQTTFAANLDNLDEQDEIAIIEHHQLPVGVVPGATSKVEMSIFDNTPTTVSLTVPDDSTTSGDLAASAEIRLTLNRPLVGEESLTVPLLFTGAEPGEDFSLALDGNPNGVTFDAVAPSLTFSGPSNGVGASEVSILLNALAGSHRNDRKVNVSIPAESFDNGQNLVAINLSGGAIGARAGTGDITFFAKPKSSDPVVRIESTATRAVLEGATATFTASVDTSPAEDLTILLNVSGSYLTSGFAGHHQIILKAGQTRADFNVPVLADTVDKLNGEIRVQVRDNPGVYAVHTSLGSAVVTVFDDDATFVSLSTTGGQLVEGGSQKLTIQLSRGLVDGERLEVPLQFMGSAVRNSDFILSGQYPAKRGVTYANLNRSGNNADSIAKVIFTGPVIGQSAQFAELTLAAVADGQTEGPESVSVVIFLIDDSSHLPPSWDGLSGGVQASKTVHSLTISDTDVGVNAVNLSVNGASSHMIIEDEGSVAIAATLDSVNLSDSVVNIPISVNTTTSSADHNDYQVAATIPIAPGEFFGTAVFQVKNDREDEPIENVTIEMGGALPDGIVPGTGQAVRIGIVDNDPTIVSLVRTDSGAIGEGGIGSLQQAEFKVSLGRGLVAGEVVHVPLDITGDAITENDITLALSSGAGRNHGVALDLITSLASVVTFIGQDTEVVQVANLVLTALPDDVDEADEALTVSLGLDGETERVNSWAVRANVSDGGVISHGRENQFNVVIESQVESYVKVPELAQVIEDENGAGSIELIGDPRIDTSVTVRYASGTAVGASSCDSGVDYISDTVEFGLRAGVDVKRVPILTRCADDQDEHDETYTLQWDARAPVFDASAPNCRSATTCSTKVVIVDDDATRVDVTIPDRSAREGDRTQSAQIVLNVSRSLIAHEKLFVPLIFSENAADENFTLALKDNPQGVSLDEQSRVVTFSGSDNSPSALAAAIELTALEDDNETAAILTVSIPRIAVDFHHRTQGMTLAARSNQYIVGGDIIIEDRGRQTPPVAGFKGTAVEVIESAGDLNVDVVVDSVAETDLELIYRVSGSATPGQDYLIEGLNEQVGRVTIAQGRTGASIRVAIVDDGVDEARETLVLTLYASSGYMVGDFAQHTTTIVDNDEPIEPVINISGRSEIEEGQSSIFDLQADVEAPVDLQINLEVTQTGDFVSAGELDRSTVTILAGQRSATFEVATVDDAAFETPGAVTVSIDAGPGYRVGTTNVATVGVQDNDSVISRELARLWLTRFGRAVTGEIIESIGARIGNDDRSTGLNAKLAGTPIGVDAKPVHPEISEYSNSSGVQYRAKSGFYQSLAELRDPTAATESGLKSLTEEMFLTGSDFTLTGETDRGETKGFWGRGFILDIDGQSDGLSSEGEVKGVTIGHDVTGASAGREYLAGVLLSHASGSGQFTEANGGGKIESTLQSFVPYGSMEVREGLDIWAAMGLGTGEMTVRRDHGIASSTDIDWQLLAGGFDQALQPIVKFGLTLYGDYSRTWTNSKANSMGFGSNSQTSRSRLGLKLTTEKTTSKHATIQLTGKLALRQDSGDAETGEGVEAGGEFAYVDPRGYNVKVQGRALVAHSDSQIREQGLSVALQYDPEPETLRGFSGQLGLGTGSNTNSHALFGNEVMSGTSSAGTGEPSWNADIAYGLAYRQGLAASPYAKFSGTDAIEQGQFGVRISKDKSFAPDLKIDVFVSAKKPDGGSGAGTDVGAGLSLVRHW